MRGVGERLGGHGASSERALSNGERGVQSCAQAVGGRGGRRLFEVRAWYLGVFLCVCVCTGGTLALSVVAVDAEAFLPLREGDVKLIGRRTCHKISHPTHTRRQMQHNQNLVCCLPPIAPPPLHTSLRSDIGGERRLRPLLPVAERADILKAERSAPLLGEFPSKKNAEGEKLPGVNPCSASGVPPVLNPEPKNEADMLIIVHSYQFILLPNEFHRMLFVEHSCVYMTARLYHTPAVLGYYIQNRGVRVCLREGGAYRLLSCWLGEDEALATFLMLDVTFFDSPNTDLNPHVFDGVPVCVCHNASGLAITRRGEGSSGERGREGQMGVGGGMVTYASREQG